MKNLKRVMFLLYLIPFMLFTACDEKENEAPVCEIVNPVEGATIMQGDQVVVKAEADDEDGSITEITIYIEGEEMNAAAASMVTYTWNTTDEDLGEWVLSALATDDEDKSAAVNITVLLDSPGGFNTALSYGTVNDIDGNTYGTIEIGDQTWMAENLKVKHYPDGKAIPHVEDESTWDALDMTSEAYCWYENLLAYGDTCGALYTWAAAVNGSAGSDLIPSGIQGVCPDGWHIPSDTEWKVLEMFLGMSQTDADKHGWRGSDEGGPLKETGFSKWDIPNEGADNSTGFTAVPGGFRSAKGLYYSFGEYATFWTASDEIDTDMAWFRMLHANTDLVYRQDNFRGQGLSVRCLKD